MARLHDLGLLQREVADADDALRNLHQRAVAAVVGQPLRASDRCRREAALRPELPRAVGPEVADRLRRTDLLLRGARQRRALGARAGLEAAEYELRGGEPV